MTIQGVKNVDVSLVKSMYVELDGMFTNGHSFCELIVNEKRKNFVARLFNGEVYSHTFGGEQDFIPFLIRVFEDSATDEYLYRKIADLSIEDFIDTSETARNLQNRVLELRKNDRLDEYEARDLCECLHDFESLDVVHGNDIYDVIVGIFSDNLKEKLFEEDVWNDPAIVYKKDYKAWIFCKKVAPILAEVLRAEYGLKEEALDLFYELQEIYEDYKPNDESFLEEYPDLVEQMDALDKLNPKTESEAKKMIEPLYDFVCEWFPDSVDEEEQERIQQILEQARSLMKEGE